jgi:hypothetical protein
MTRAEANAILDRWKLGLEWYHPMTINQALFVLGDLE